MYRFGKFSDRRIHSSLFGVVFEGNDGAGKGGNGGGSDDKGDTDKSGGKNTDADKNKGGGDSDADGGKNKGTDDANGDQGKDKSKNGDKKHTDEDVERIVKERVEREKRKSAGEFQKLYEDLEPVHNATKTELETTKAENTSLKAILNGQIDAAIAEWPASLKKLDPGSDNYAARATWFESSADIVKEMGGGEKKRVDGEGGNKGGGKPTNVVASYVSNTYSLPGQEAGK